jgi:hypothetical protein
MEAQNDLPGARSERKEKRAASSLLFYVIIPVFALFIFESAQKKSPKSSPAVARNHIW